MLRRRSCHIKRGFFTLSVASLLIFVQIEPKTEECFFEDIQAGEDVEALALVYRGGKLDIKLRVSSPDARATADPALRGGAAGSCAQRSSWLRLDGTRRQCPSHAP